MLLFLSCTSIHNGAHTHLMHLYWIVAGLVELQPSSVSFCFFLSCSLFSSSCWVSKTRTTLGWPPISTTRGEIDQTRKARTLEVPRHQLALGYRKNVRSIRYSSDFNWHYINMTRLIWLISLSVHHEYVPEQVRISLLFLSISFPTFPSFTSVWTV